MGKSFIGPHTNFLNGYWGIKRALDAKIYFLGG